MVNKEAFTDCRSGMDVDAGFGVGDFGHYPRYDGDSQAIQHMGETVNGDGIKPRVGHYNFHSATGCRVSLVSGRYIRFDQCADFRQFGNELVDNLTRRTSAREQSKFLFKVGGYNVQDIVLAKLPVYTRM